MTGIGTSESPAFEGPNFPEPDLDLDLDLDDVDDVNDESNASDAQVEDASVNRVDGGTPRAVLEFVARSIVEDPESVHVDTDESRGALKLSLHVAPSDMGRIIGKRGRVAQAIRALVRAAAAKEGTDASVDIVD